MTVYLVTWNLNKEGSVYAATSKLLHERLDTLETIRDFNLETVRFVSTNLKTEELYNYIEQGVFDKNDRIIVSKMKGNEYFGLLNLNVWNWLNERL